jgi:Uncharacterized protein conserved in bacteria (DUF2059)
MIRELTALAVLGMAFATVGVPAAATIRPEGVRAVARPDDPPEAETRGLDTLLERSGLGVQLESLSAVVRVQFQPAGRRLSGQDRLTIDRIVSERFAANALYARIRREFAQNLDAAKLTTALAWYNSPLGNRIIGLELAALVYNGGSEAVADLESNRPLPRRLALIQRLDAGGGTSETTLDMTVAIVRSLTRAFQHSLPAVARLSPAQLDEELTRARNRTLEQFRDACLVSMIFAYRTLSDHELDQYVQFVESEAGQWYMGMKNSTLLTAVEVASEAAAAELVTAVPHLADDLR